MSSWGRDIEPCLNDLSGLARTDSVNFASGSFDRAERGLPLPRCLRKSFRPPNFATHLLMVALVGAIRVLPWSQPSFFQQPSGLNETRKCVLLRKMHFHCQKGYQLTNFCVYEFCRLSDYKHGEFEKKNRDSHSWTRDKLSSTFFRHPVGNKWLFKHSFEHNSGTGVNELLTGNINFTDNTLSFRWINI